jgi:hypothetical protein
MQFNRPNLVEFGSLARLFWSRASGILSRFQLRYSPSTQNELHVVPRKSVITKHHLIISSCRTLASGVVRSVRIQGRPTHRHTLGISTLASRADAGDTDAGHRCWRCWGHSFFLPSPFSIFSFTQARDRVQLKWKPLSRVLGERRRSSGRALFVSMERLLTIQSVVPRSITRPKHFSRDRQPHCRASSPHYPGRGYRR